MKISSKVFSPVFLCDPKPFSFDFHRVGLEAFDMRPISRPSSTWVSFLLAQPSRHRRVTCAARAACLSTSSANWKRKTMRHHPLFNSPNQAALSASPSSPFHLKKTVGVENTLTPTTTSLSTPPLTVPAYKRHLEHHNSPPHSSWPPTLLHSASSALSAE
jgi:hypothetical protein